MCRVNGDCCILLRARPLGWDAVVTAVDARAVYRRIAPYYDFLDGSFERKRYAPIRGTLFAGLSGRILDAGIGTGCNIPYYPAGAEVVGIDLSQAMLAQARARRDGLGSAVPFAAMDVLRTAFPDSSFDAVVASFVFCVLRPDQQQAALTELGRILKPGGEIRLLDYTWSKRPWRRFVMGLWGRPGCGGPMARASTASLIAMSSPPASPSSRTAS